MIISEILKLKKIRQANELVESPYSQKFTVHESKLFELAISKCTPEDVRLIEQEINKKIRYTASELAKELNTKISVISMEIENIAKRIMNKTIHLRTVLDDGTIEFRRINIIPFASYINGVFEFELNHHTIPYLIGINSNFTEFQLHYLLSMSSSYAIKLYKLLYQYKNITRRAFDIDRLKEQFGLQNKYPLYANFKKRIIEQSVSQINKKTDLYVEYKEIKLGRKIEKIEFTFYVKKGMENSILVKNNAVNNIIDVKPIVLNEPVNKKQNPDLSILFSGIESELSEQTKKLLEDFYQTKGIEFVEASIKYAKHHAKTNLDQYLINTLTQNWAEVEYKKLLDKKEQKLKNKELKQQQKQDEQQQIQEKFNRKQKIEEQWDALSDIGQSRYVEHANKLLMRYKDKLSVLKNIETLLPICCYAVSNKTSYDTMIEGYCLTLLNIELKIK